MIYGWIVSTCVPSIGIGIRISILLAALPLVAVSIRCSIISQIETELAAAVVAVVAIEEGVVYGISKT